MYKNQLQELAQRSCFNLPWYTCIREGPDHAPRFKATVNFNGEVFESPNFCTTLRQAEHSAAEVALNSLSNRNRGPSHSLAARILDETGVYKNLLQEVSQRVGAALPQYTTVRSGLGHSPVFTCTVLLAGITFTGEPAKNKKQAEKNAAMAAWSSLKQLVKQDASSSSETENSDEQEQVTIARALLNYRLKEKMEMANSPDTSSQFPKRFPVQHQRPPGTSLPPVTTSKILPLISPKSVPRCRPTVSAQNDSQRPSRFPAPEYHGVRPQKFPAVDAMPYVPIRHFRAPYHGVAPPVTIRTAVPVFSAPPIPQPANRPSAINNAPPVRIREALPVILRPSVKVKESQVLTIPPTSQSPVQNESLGKVPRLGAEQVQVDEPPPFSVLPSSETPTHAEENGNKTTINVREIIALNPIVSSVGISASAGKSSVEDVGANDQNGCDVKDSTATLIERVKQLDI